MILQMADHPSQIENKSIYLILDIHENCDRTWNYAIESTFLSAALSILAFDLMSNSFPIVAVESWNKLTCGKLAKINMRPEKTVESDIIPLPEQTVP